MPPEQAAQRKMIKFTRGTISQSPGEIKRREVVLDPQVSPVEIKRREVVLDPQVSPVEIKRREVALDPQVSPVEIKRREVVLDPQVSPVEIKRSEVELGLRGGLLLLQLFPNGGATDIVFVTLFCVAVGTAIT